MNCPRCSRPTVARTVREAKIEECPDCHGMFLDRGELNRVAEPTSGDLEYSTLHDETFDHFDRYPMTRCPRCPDAGVDMKKVEFNVHTGIILDYCDRCEGFWLDGAEMERINREIQDLNEPSKDAPAMQWLSQFLWSLPR